VPSRHAGWCERGGGASLSPISIARKQVAARCGLT
jgi:hypothetical protein